MLRRWRHVRWHWYATITLAVNAWLTWSWLWVPTLIVALYTIKTSYRVATKTWQRIETELLKLYREAYVTARRVDSKVSQTSILGELVRLRYPKLSQEAISALVAASLALSLPWTENPLYRYLPRAIREWDPTIQESEVQETVVALMHQLASLGSERLVFAGIIAREAGWMESARYVLASCLGHTVDPLLSYSELA